MTKITAMPEAKNAGSDRGRNTAVTDIWGRFRRCLFTSIRTVGLIFATAANIVRRLLIIMKIPSKQRARIINF
jgi:hypothetical protein